MQKNEITRLQKRLEDADGHKLAAISELEVVKGQLSYEIDSLKRQISHLTLLVNEKEEECISLSERSARLQTAIANSQNTIAELRSSVFDSN
jgi:peptidoglycan hydrolase CwlO-like protein